VKEFGGVKGVKEAGLDALLAVSWLPEAVARAVYERVTDHD
jgi:excinuclease UvrABC nuclease subunit